MIDNPLPDLVMQELDSIVKYFDFKTLCEEHATEIAKHYKVHEDLHEYFAEWYHDYMQQNPDLFDHTCIYLDSDYIVDWWQEMEEYFDEFDLLEFLLGR